MASPLDKPYLQYHQRTLITGLAATIVLVTMRRFF
ncbi:MAG: hypothetical protein CAPSK01_003250 [Candidatus Accumulibacter vicinus]|uniref:Uncharacterized protein n=1 Tax=Candidatus Accumulibacter vicinus TaxID=2954382 RepID=A0A084XXY8_9PROT|nr:MAG: hypothetical protein CAPSK01_003250 [Candidatus Accumulibacter vicinus]